MGFFPKFKPKNKNKKLKPVLIDVDKLATHDDISNVKKELEILKLTPKQKMERFIIKKWDSLTDKEKKKKWAGYSRNQRKLLLELLSEREGAYDAKRK